MSGVLHPDFITEFADTDLFSEGFHKAEDGYEFLSKEDFEAEFAQNQPKYDTFKSQKEEEHRVKSVLDAPQREAAAAERVEFEEFKAWKASQGNS